MRLSLIASTFALVISSPALAQIGNPAGMAPSTPLSAPGKPAPHYPNTQDRLFVHLAATGGMAEVEAGKLAAGKAQNPAVIGFAKMMVDEHSKTNDRLKALAGKADIPLPPGLDPDHKATLARLEKLSGAEFDLAYMQGQLIDASEDRSNPPMGDVERPGRRTPATRSGRAAFRAAPPGEGAGDHGRADGRDPSRAGRILGASGRKKGSVRQ